MHEINYTAKPFSQSHIQIHCLSTCTIAFLSYTNHTLNSTFTTTTTDMICLDARVQTVSLEPSATRLLQTALNKN